MLINFGKPRLPSTTREGMKETTIDVLRQAPEWFPKNCGRWTEEMETDRYKWRKMNRNGKRWT